MNIFPITVNGKPLTSVECLDWTVFVLLLVTLHTSIMKPNFSAHCLNSIQFFFIIILYNQYNYYINFLFVHLFMGGHLLLFVINHMFPYALFIRHGAFPHNCLAPYEFTLANSRRKIV